MGQPLFQLARLYGVQTSYEDVDKKNRDASTESLLEVLRILGAPLQRADDAPEAIRARELEYWQQVIEPVVVAWEGDPGPIPLRIPADEASHAFCCNVDMEDGRQRAFSGRIEDLATCREHQQEGRSYLVKHLKLPDRLPYGYHRLSIELSGRMAAESMLISAPITAWELPEDQRRLWGVFLPLYSLHSRPSWGSGNLSDLGALMDWIASRGGSLVASLPLLAASWEPMPAISPYSPSSRLFWNEFYLDVTRVPQFHECAKARTIIESPRARAEVETMRNERLVDYPRQMKLQRAVLEALSQCFFAGPANRRAELEAYCRRTPEVESFARFRAAAERQGRAWSEWDEPLQSGTLRPDDYDEAAYRCHLYAQWQVEEQLVALAARAREKNLLWYLDFPLGVSGIGYDSWRWQDLFAWGADGGAPPDTFFTKGQKWGFPPLHPERLRRQGYRYLVSAIRRHLQYAKALRIDHAMSLQRLYWVPEQMDATEGVYVSYPTDELFAILTLESRRHNAWIIGENLGTVADSLNEALQRHRIAGMHVVQLEVRPDHDPPLPPAPSTTVASINTHDTPQFAAFWTGLDIDNSHDLELVTADQAAHQREEREAMRRRLIELLHRQGFLTCQTFDPAQVLEALLAWLASSDSRVVLVNLEDLWQELEPQNTPGTSEENRPNWRRKAKYSLEEFRNLPQVDRVLQRIAQCRRRTS